MKIRYGQQRSVSNVKRYSVAMTDDVEKKLRSALLRPDGQEDLCLVVYQTSTGLTRTTAILTEIILPLEGETIVHGNVSFTGDYVLRAAAIAAKYKGGIAVLHSHPGGSGWQMMSGHDEDAESSFANLVREITGLPLVGMTLAGINGTWSARFWNNGVGVRVASEHCESVRVISDRLGVSWNPILCPPSSISEELTRSVYCWGPGIHADIERLRILVVGAGTLGLDVAIRLAATGIRSIGIMDFDSVNIINLDRLIGATPLDVWLHRSKLEVAVRLLRQNATAKNFQPEAIEGSICEPTLFANALDYDLIFCCIDDHPWPRSILNTIAYTDLIPVIDGGIHVDAFLDGNGMRNATWRTHVLRPGRPCMACNGQIDLGKIYADKSGLLDDVEYITGLPPSERPQSQNVAALAVSATASLLAQFVSFVVAPADMGDPGPLRYQLSTHWLEHVLATTREHCPIEQSVLAGDRRQVLLGDHPVARKEILMREEIISRPFVRLGRAIDDTVNYIELRLTDAARLALTRRSIIRNDNNFFQPEQ